MSSKGIMLIMLVMVLVVPGAYGISVSVSGGDGGRSFYDNVNFNPLDHDNLMVYSTISAATLEQDASGIGDLHKSFGASSRRGEKAQITADVVNAASWEYTQPAVFADASTAWVTGFTLTATDANSIKCNTGAVDRWGDKASAITEVNQGSLYNYHGDAFASSDGVSAMQSFDFAFGAQVAAKEMASNPIGVVATNTNVQNGGIFVYSNAGLTFADRMSTETVGQFEAASGNTIGAESSAFKRSGPRSNTNMNVAGTDTQTAFVSGYGSAAAVGLGFETGAEQILSGEADGNTIGLLASSSNAERDISSLKTDIQGTETEPGFISGYADITESFRDSVFASNRFSQADAEGIHLSSASSNKKGDRANANMNAAGDGQITHYEGFSSASAKTSSANNNILDPGTIAGKNIEYDVSAFDARRNSATISNEVRDGSIIGSVSNTVDISPNQLIAAQVGNGISGSFMQRIYDAREMATRQTVHNSTEFHNPSNLNYSLTLTVNR